MSTFRRLCSRAPRTMRWSITFHMLGVGSDSPPFCDLAPAPTGWSDGYDEGISFRWALAGYGAGGRTFHQPLISSAAGLELVAVVTASAERQAQVRADLPGATPVAALAGPAGLGVQGVTITTPTATHAALAHEALDLGLHVVVDKPFALTADRCPETWSTTPPGSAGSSRRTRIVAGTVTC